jgi:7-carboxy-7-deazaguanine synthase
MLLSLCFLLILTLHTILSLSGRMSGKTTDTTRRKVYVSPMNIYNEEPQTAKTARMSNQTSLEQRSTVEEVISFWTPGLLDMEANQRNHEYVRDYAKKHGLLANLQMHLYLGAA